MPTSSRRLQVHKKFLKGLRDGNRREVSTLVQHSSRNQQKAMGEVLHSILHGFTKVKNKIKRYLRPHIKLLRKFSDPSTPDKTRHKIATMNGGGFMGSVMKKALSGAAKSGIKKRTLTLAKRLAKNKKLKRQVIRAAKSGLPKSSKKLHTVEEEITSPEPAVYKTDSSENIPTSELQLRIHRIDQLLSKYGQR